MMGLPRSVPGREPSSQLAEHLLRDDRKHRLRCCFLDAYPHLAIGILGLGVVAATAAAADLAEEDADVGVERAAFIRGPQHDGGNLAVVHFPALRHTLVQGQGAGLQIFYFVFERLYE